MNNEESKSTNESDIIKIEILQKTLKSIANSIIDIVLEYNGEKIIELYTSFKNNESKYINILYEMNDLCNLGLKLPERENAKTLNSIVCFYVFTKMHLQKEKERLLEEEQKNKS